MIRALLARPKGLAFRSSGSSKGIIKNQLTRSAKNLRLANFWRRIGAEFLGKIVNFSAAARSDLPHFVPG